MISMFQVEDVASPHKYGDSGAVRASRLRLPPIRLEFTDVAVAPSLVIGSYLSDTTRPWAPT